MAEKTEKPKMDIETFQKVNKAIMEIIDVIKPFDDVSISTAKRGLMDVGMKISEYFFKYEQKPETDNKD